MTRAIVLWLVLVLGCVASAAPPLVPDKPLVTDKGPSPEIKAYEKFRTWLSQQSPELQKSVEKSLEAGLGRYAEALKKQGVEPSAIDSELRLLRAAGARPEVERWNRILTSPEPHFNAEPNAYLMAMIKGRAAGRALDVGMGQGRNALALARTGWLVTGFDPAEKAVALASEQAARAGLKIEAVVMTDDTFDFGKERWDLIVLSYVRVRENAKRVLEGLKPGGVVIVEGVHRDAQVPSTGGLVVFDNNELLRLFEGMRVLHYEDVVAPADFGQGDTRRSSRIVRLTAEKPRK